MMSTSSKLRRPNFSRTTAAASSRTTGGIVDINSSSGSNSAPLSLLSASCSSSTLIANYTRQCHKKIIALSAHNHNHTPTTNNANADAVNDGQINTTAGDSSNDTNSNTTTTATTTDTTSNTSIINTSMEQCITLLEPSLNTFYKACVQIEKKKEKKIRTKSKKNKTKSSSNSSKGGDEGNDGMNGLHNAKQGEEGGGDIITDEDQEQEDEVPPQLLRLARFFPYRWHPMKKALLRPPPITPTTTNDITNDTKSSGSGGSGGGTVNVQVEVGIQYRLRLARACYKRGLVAAVEYQVLLKEGAFLLFDQDEDEERRTRRRSLCCDDDETNASFKRYKKTAGPNAGNDHTHSSLSERVRLSLMRLPTDSSIAIIHYDSNTNDPSSSSSSVVAASASWRHVQEVLLEYCTQWVAQMKKDEDEDGATNNGERDGYETAIITTETTTTPTTTNTDLAIVPPQQVADWIMTCWTALLLSSQGMSMDGSSSPSTFLGNTNGANASSSSFNIELQLAALLSDKSSQQQTSYPIIAQAVAVRIDNLLSPTNLQLLNGIHVYSLGRLLALFHLQEDAEIHIATSIAKCSLTMGDGSGSGGGATATGSIMGLEQLSRLLAVYSCYYCGLSASAATAATTDCINGNDLLTMRNTNNNDTSSSSPSKKEKCIIKDLEGRLRANLDETSEVVKRIATEKATTGDDDNGMSSSSSCCLKDISTKAKSFLDVVVGATAHLVRYSVP